MVLVVLYPMVVRDYKTVAVARQGTGANGLDVLLAGLLDPRELQQLGALGMGRHQHVGEPRWIVV